MEVPTTFRAMSLFDRRLLVTAGKGGVGRSTITAALALAASKRGKRVLVCEVNVQERISGLLGVRATGNTIGRVAHGVDAVVVRPDEAMREYGLMKLRYQAVYKAVFENPFVSRFLHFIPSLPELVMLGKILFHARQGPWDLVLVDGPATGHGITFLGVPQALLDTIPPGSMRSEAEWMRDFLRDPRTTAVNLVALPEELPVNETMELAAATRGRLGMTLGGAFLNRFVARRFSDEERTRLPAGTGHAAFDPALRAARAHGIRSDMSGRYLDRLQRDLPVSVTPLPLLHPARDFGRESIEELARHMAAL
ncbi:MAG TPA: ArsA-related P-loop ATPase [Vulgatibacter sp.]